MVFAVAENYVVASRHSRNNPEIALKASAEGHGVLFAEKVGQLFFQREVNVHRAVEKTAAAASRAIIVQRVFSCLDDFAVGGKPQIIV